MRTSPLNSCIIALFFATIAVFPIGLPCSAKQLSQESQATKITDTSKAVSIPIHLNTAHIFVDVMVNGKGPYSFALDTGAPYSAIDSRAAKQTKLKLTGSVDAGGSGEKVRKAQFANNVNLGLPGVNLANQTMVALSLEDFEPILGRKIDGILGIDLFLNFVVEIDYAASRLRVYDNETFRYDGRGKSVPVSVQSRRCRAKATVVFPGRKPLEGNFVIDTGANISVRLNQPYVVEHDLTKSLTKSIESKDGYGIGGRSTSIIGRVESFEFGGLKFKQPVIHLSQAKKGAGANAAVAGIIGGGLLKRCNVVFDFKRKRMILRPNPDFDSPYEFDMLGLRWKTGGRGDFKSFSVSGVLEDSAAFQAGIQVDDKLVEVNGIKPKQLSIPRLRKLARVHNGVFRITVKRGDKTIKREIKLTRKF